MYLSTKNDTDSKFRHPSHWDPDDWRRSYGMGDKMCVHFDSGIIQSLLEVYPLLGVGACRAVFDAGSHVIKVPLSALGCEANRTEAAQWCLQEYLEARKGQLPYDFVHVPRVLRYEKFEGLDVLWVEKCSPVFLEDAVSWEDQVPWRRRLEDAYDQVGFSKHQGRVVCYDLSHDQEELEIPAGRLFTRAGEMCGILPWR